MSAPPFDLVSQVTESLRQLGWSESLIRVQQAPRSGPVHVACLRSGHVVGFQSAAYDGSKHVVLGGVWFHLGDGDTTREIPNSLELDRISVRMDDIVWLAVAEEPAS